MATRARAITKTVRAAAVSPVVWRAGRSRCSSAAKRSWRVVLSPDACVQSSSLPHGIPSTMTMTAAAAAVGKRGNSRSHARTQHNTHAHDAHFFLVYYISTHTYTHGVEMRLFTAGHAKNERRASNTHVRRLYTGGSRTATASTAANTRPRPACHAIAVSFRRGEFARSARNELIHCAFAVRGGSQSTPFTFTTLRIRFSRRVAT